MKLNKTTSQYIEEYREKIDAIPAGAQKVADHRTYGVGPVYYTIGTDIYIANHTGSDVPEWAVQYFSFTDAEDANPSNEDIIAMLTADEPQRNAPKLTLCACGHHTQSPMTASRGTSCPDCYDRMSN